jgi:pseudouridine synthase
MLNGEICRKPEQKVSVSEDDICFDGTRILYSEFLYYMLNKPAGVVSATIDNVSRTVLDLIKDKQGKDLFPVGRLDYDTEGLLLLTNDGDFTNHMIHPRYKIDKIYLARVEGKVASACLNKLREGILLEDGPTAPAGVKLVKVSKGNTLLEITIHEGRKRQVKRMCLAVSHPVLSLKRIGFGFLTLKGVETGQFRYLTADEVLGLERLAGTE